MKNNCIDQWNSFKNALSQAVTETPLEDASNAWNSSSERTQFYFDFLLPKVSHLMELGFEKEKLFRVDAVFYKKANNGYQIPIVYIESENNVQSSYEEIYKLCCLNAPLKILFICVPWTPENKKLIVDDDWQYIVQDFASEDSLQGYLGIIVAEWMEEGLKFYALYFDQNGNLSDEGVLVRRQ
jgi:hypothetical protein